ncbi:hypothetical protein GGQ79_004862 [Ochrobactrum pecoris]|uniref:Uncharacterized protein n=1 Tax=Brucella pecoris TaxID=867683 RepID=A0AB34YY71_9HYPH|nr:hypothetical protein [Brucella pecoris]
MTLSGSSRTIADYFAVWSVDGRSFGTNRELAQDKSACAANPISLAGQRFVLCMAVGRGHGSRQAMGIQYLGMHGHYRGLEGMTDDQQR